MPLVSHAELITAIAQGHPASFPTDTVPALAARPDCADRIFQLKQRQPDKPLILMGATPEQLWDYVRGTPEELQIWATLADQYWPGALTLVLPANERVPVTMNPLNPGTIGVRVPNSNIARSILSHTGALATTSANLSGQPPLIDPQAIGATFPDAYVLNPESVCSSSDQLNDQSSLNQAITSGIPSTVVQWKNHHWITLRQGAITIPER